ncbi:uncharacterized protein Z518_02494 [Rhinocladiella mackenziei CBS 650.93]|uniref:Rhinocladiella mackenziei CBS 650.93 unplaced genomic scaffold supercont1.2, whole genome shotgun sequence n=1 Tax=Rhinocladiella mackenziei CBS 650.93 TaxID=1442369 RepID=A0A0D2JF51_9EURO|nr:uncharacterized protein Z518_02494 [Rhinocladiella mackenziei CBS 650.93]KIX07840.1 hypothetical protein Z518_02494 [Rhinocladiella mackenziei CBS 650.93]
MPVDGSDPTEGSADDNEPVSYQSSRRPKISRACLACRSSKTRCIPVEGIESCEACVRRNRPCLIPGPAKPRVKTSQKFSELEKKIESLTTALAARSHSGQLESHDAPDTTISSMSSEPLTNVSKSPEHSGRFRYRNDSSEPLQDSCLKISGPREYVDVIDRGLIDIPTAEVLFNHWDLSMRPILPLLNLADTPPARIRETKPTLFLAILAVASASILPAFESPLVTELNEQLARQILILGKKSIDLIQAILLYSQYYIRPSVSNNYACTQYISAAITMSCDMAIGRKVRGGSRSDIGRVEQWARTWLAGWFAASTNATLLRQQYPMPPVHDLESCLNVLSSDTNTDLSDQWFCSLIQLQLILEDVSNLLSNQAKLMETFDEPSTQYKMQMFRRRLDNWKESAPRAVDECLRKCAAHFTNLCIHHVAIRSYHQKVYPPSQKQNTSRPSDNEVTLSTPHFESLCISMEAAQGVLNAYLSIEDTRARLLPNMYLLWTLYAAVSLIKLSHFAGHILSQNTAVPANESGETSVLQYLDAMINKTSKISTNGYLPQAKPCGIAFIKLKTWYVHKLDVCINSDGVCDVTRGPVYSVFGNGPEPTLPDSVTVSESEPAPSVGQQGSGQRRGISSGHPPHGESIQQRENRGAFVPNPDSAQNPMSDMEKIQGFDPRNMADAVYHPLTYANTDWDDLAHAEAMREFDTLMMMDGDDSWMKTLF